MYTFWKSILGYIERYSSLTSNSEKSNSENFLDVGIKRKSKKQVLIEVNKLCISDP